MNIADFLHQQGDKRGFSFEILPPLKGNGTAALFRTIDALSEFGPRFINITTHHSEYVYKELENWYTHGDSHSASYHKHHHG